MEKYEIVQADNASFLSFADELLKGPPPKPLRRTFSLVRLLKCETFIYSTKICRMAAEENFSCGDHFSSCEKFRDTIQNKRYKYSYRLEEKKCFKFIFFSKKFLKIEEISPLIDDDLIGYVLIHRDLLKDDRKRSISDDNLIKRIYTPQCFIRNPFNEECFGLSTRKHIINIQCESVSKQFKIDSHYFSQENKITNCCTQAALKSALKCQFPNLTAEEINSKVGIDHYNRLGTVGLEPDEYKKAIEILSDNKLTAFCLKANDMETYLDFWQSIYFAVESRFPVILLFDIPWEKDKLYGHALTVIGHTLNKHNWWSYGLKGHTGLNIEELKYFSSVIWCNNFVIQDDRVGPYYLLPKNFLSYSQGPPEPKSKLKRKLCEILNSFKNGSDINKEFLYDPLYAIIITPRNIIDMWKDVLSVEPFAYIWLKRFIELLEKEEILEEPKKDENDFQDLDIFKLYFGNYYLDSLILRTLFITKDEYLESIQDQNIMRNFGSEIDQNLPDSFFITELSIPELFWINYGKVGEIIISTDFIGKSVQDRDTCVLLLRLPKLIVFCQPELKPHKVDQSRNYYKMSSPKGICHLNL